MHPMTLSAVVFDHIHTPVKDSVRRIAPQDGRRDDDGQNTSSGECPASNATIVGAILGFWIAVISTILLFVKFVSWTWTWEIVVRRILGVP